MAIHKQVILCICILQFLLSVIASYTDENMLSDFVFIYFVSCFGMLVLAVCILFCEMGSLLYFAFYGAFLLTALFVTALLIKLVGNVFIMPLDEGYELILFPFIYAFASPVGFLMGAVYSFYK